MFSRSDGAILLGVAFLLVLYLGLRVWLTVAPEDWSSVIEKYSAKSGISLIDVNRASIAELAQLPGIGLALAERIVRHRLERGPFRSLDELLEVPGIGPHTLETLRPWVQICSPSPCK
jgi:competence ComEA-like helix-hairpin-helix protein